MIRTPALGLTLLLQLAAGFAPSGFVLCVHDDGHRFLESAAMPCCRACPRAEQVPEAARGGSPAAAVDRAGEGDGHEHCRDYLLGAPEARTSVARSAMTDGGGSGETTGPAPALAAASVPPPVLDFGEWTRGTGPPRTRGSLAFLRTVVLRC